MFILDTAESLAKEKLNQDNACIYAPSMSQLSTDFSQISIQTKSKYIIETKYINMSLVQMLVHLLFKIIRNVNKINNTTISLNQVLETARMRNGFERIGDGIVCIARLLVKLERLCDECKIQITETIHKLDQNQSMINTHSEPFFPLFFEKNLSETGDTGQKISMKSVDEEDDNIECCICRNKDDKSPLGIVVRLTETNGKSLPFLL